MTSPRRIALFLILLCMAWIACVWLSGCSQTDREYSVTYDADRRAALAGVRITPGSGQRSFSANVRGEIDWTLGNSDIAHDK